MGKMLFWGCKNLEVVELPEWLEVIGEQAFEMCSSLKELTLPQWVKRIEWRAFEFCSSLQILSIPSYVTHIGSGAFSGCSSLVRIKVDSNNPVYDSREDCNAIIHTESNALIRGCSNTIIPPSVTSIESRAFIGCTSLTLVKVSKNTEVAGNAFRYCPKVRIVRY